MRKLLAFFLVACLPAHACLWDFDTVEQESKRFPSVLQLMTGRFPRHTPEFYRWRLDDRLKRLKNAPQDDRLLDDVAVSYEKLGQHHEAIDIAKQQLGRNPTRYESLANLGTFYIHAGQLQEGLGFIKAAIEVNPQAHFGREIYQAKLVEYLILSNNTRPLTHCEHFGESDFAHFLKPEGPLSSVERNAAIRGVLGMMRFGHHDSPVLLEVLAGLLNEESDDLAARALLKASYAFPPFSARDKYRDFAGQVKFRGYSLKETERQFAKELQQGQLWYDKFAAEERAWIKAGKNPETEYRKHFQGQESQLDQSIEQSGFFEKPPSFPANSATSLNSKDLLALASVWSLLMLPVAIFIAMRSPAPSTKDRSRPGGLGSQ